MTAQAYIDEKLKLWNVEYPTTLLVAEMQRVGLGLSDEFNEENERKTKLFSTTLFLNSYCAQCPFLKVVYLSLMTNQLLPHFTICFVSS